MNNSYLDKAVEELQLHVDREEAFKHNHTVLTEKEHSDIYKVVKQPKVFPKVEYSKCVTVVDNR